MGRQARGNAIANPIPPIFPTAPLRAKLKGMSKPHSSRLLSSQTVKLGGDIFLASGQCAKCAKTCNNPQILNDLEEIQFLQNSPMQICHPSGGWDLGPHAQPFAALDPSFCWGDGLTWVRAR